jgi:excisionase family DNA binding protein
MELPVVSRTTRKALTQVCVDVGDSGRHRFVGLKGSSMSRWPVHRSHRRGQQCFARKGVWRPTAKLKNFERKTEILNMKVFTTGQVAKICKVAPRTVSKWFDSGRLKGYRIPGSQDRRIPREYLIKFLKEHGMPLGDLEDEAMAKVLIVAQDQVLIENLKRELPLERSFKVGTAASGFEAGIQAESFHPDCMIVDFSIGKVEALQICQNLRKNNDFTDIILIALLPDDGQTFSFDRSSINETFKKPFDARLLAERLRTLIGGKKELV